jgi:hypothetical protein
MTEYNYKKPLEKYPRAFMDAMQTAPALTFVPGKARYFGVIMEQTVTRQNAVRTHQEWGYFQRRLREEVPQRFVELRQTYTSRASIVKNPIHGWGIEITWRINQDKELSPYLQAIVDCL